MNASGNTAVISARARREVAESRCLLEITAEFTAESERAPDRCPREGECCSFDICVVSDRGRGVYAAGEAVCRNRRIDFSTCLPLLDTGQYTLYLLIRSNGKRFESNPIDIELR